MQRDIMHMSGQTVQLIMAMFITQWQVKLYTKFKVCFGAVICGFKAVGQEGSDVNNKKKNKIDLNSFHFKIFTVSLYLENRCRHVV